MEGFAIGRMMECFRVEGMTPVSHMLLNNQRMTFREDIGSLRIISYSTPSSPGDEFLLHCLIAACNS